MGSLTTLLLAFFGLSACGPKAYQDADVQTFAALLETEVQLVDVRTPSEYAAGHLAGAVNIDVKADSFMVKAQAQLDTLRPVAVYCRSGMRSALASKRLAAQGFQVTNLKGGIQAWQASGQPVTTECP